MRVCLLNDSFPPVIDGVVNVMLNYANYLQSDHASQVIVGTPRYPDADYSAYPYPVVAYPSFDTTSVTTGYRTGNPLAGKALASLAAFHPDLIHSHCPATATIIARLLREECGAPIVFTYHTKYDIDIARAVGNKLAAHEGVKAMVSNIAACDDIWVVSRGAGESLKALGFEGDYRVVTNGVDFARGRVCDADVGKATAGYDLPAGVPLFLYVGRMMNYKGLPLLLKALRGLKDAGQDFRMVMIGKGPDREELEKTARDYGLMGSDGPDKVIFTGAIYERDTLRAWNTRADLFLFPSTFDTNGLVVREAAACGLASVLIAGSCAAEGVTDGRNGFTISETPEALAALLARLCLDLPHLREVGQKAMDEIYVDWRTCVAEAYERYEYVLEKKRSGALAKRKRELTDYLVAWTARSMSSQDKFRRLRQELFADFKDSALGMMENAQEAREQAPHFWERLLREREKDADASNAPKGDA